VLGGEPTIIVNFERCTGGSECKPLSSHWSSQEKQTNMDINMARTTCLRALEQALFHENRSYGGFAVISLRNLSSRPCYYEFSVSRQSEPIKSGIQRHAMLMMEGIL
jgi:hypothetical protein